MFLECASCRNTVSILPGDRRPAWCPRCGGDWKKAAATAPASPATSPAPAPVPQPIEAPRVEVNDAPAAAKMPASMPARMPVDAPVEMPAAGAPAEVFSTSLVWHLAAWGCLVVCMGLVAVAVSQAIHPPRGKAVQIGVYGCMGLFGVGALVAVAAALHFAGQKYEVFADRLVRWQFFQPTSYAWEQVREVYQDVHPGWTVYRIVTRQGTFTVNSEIANHKRLADLIANQVADRLLPAAVKELEAGREVRFGVLRVSGSGVTVDGQLEPWHRIGILSYGLNRLPRKGTSRISKMIHVRLGNAWVEVGSIPNFRLFELLALQMASMAPGSVVGVN